MRGRLIFAFTAEVYPLDTSATAADPDGGGPLVAGYDPIFREPVKLPATSGEGPGTSNRVEGAPIRLPCQVEVGTAYKVNMFFSGDSPDTRMVLVFHFKDLEKNNLIISSNGLPALQNQVRLNAIYEKVSGNLAQRFDRPLFCDQVEPTGFGFGAKRNLVVLYFKERAKSPQ